MNHALLQQALDALEGLFGVPDHMMGGGGGVAVWRLGGSAPVRDAIEALKAELAKPEPEPVAYLAWRDANHVGMKTAFVRMRFTLLMEMMTELRCQFI